MFGGFPFGGGSFGGGASFGGGGFEQARPKSDNTKFYELLGVSKDATEDDLKKAYRKLSLKHHPDKGGDPEYFKLITSAYGVLKDPQQKEIYDKYGEEAIKEGMQSQGSAGGFEDILGGLFGGSGGGGRRATRKRKGESVQHTIKVSLEELYKGVTRTLQISRQSQCETCEGYCTLSKKEYKCERCKGQGVIMKVQQIGPGMIQQTQQVCPKCQGNGTTVPPEDKCTKCDGKGYNMEKKVFEIHIEPGMKHHQKIVKREEGGFVERGVIPGDVIFLIEQTQHATFQRIASDLLVIKKINLKESLCGCQVKIKHLDGRQLVIDFPQGQVIKPDSWRFLQEEGMPVNGMHGTHGNLYINFDIEYPSKLDLNTVKQLEKILPDESATDDQTSSGKENMELDGEDIEHVQGNKLKAISDIKVELKKRQEWTRSMEQAYGAENESDEEDGAGAQRVQCQQQ